MGSHNLLSIVLDVSSLQPENIYDFGAKYFSDLLAQQQAGDSQTGGAAYGADGRAAPGLENVRETATTLDIGKLTPAELEPVILREWRWAGWHTCSNTHSPNIAALLHAWGAAACIRLHKFSVLGL